MEQRLQELKEKIIYANPFEDKRYTIKCSKCGHIFDYGHEDLNIKMIIDRNGNATKVRDRFVECPKCFREYDFGYESKSLK